MSELEFHFSIVLFVQMMQTLHVYLGWRLPT